MELHHEHGRELKRMNLLKGVLKISKKCRIIKLTMMSIRSDKYVQIPAPDFPAIHSTIIAMVIREGKPCGLNTISGTMPDSVHGKSSQGQRREHIPVIL